MKKILLTLLLLLTLGFLCGCAWVREPEPDYRDLVIRAATQVDPDSGRAAAAAFNAKLDESGSDEARIDFDELLLLSRFLYAAAGDSRLTDEQRHCAGEVALNRVASPEFPDTLEGVLFQEAAYPEVQAPDFPDGIRPSLSCVQTALALLQGRRLLDQKVVYQSDRKLPGGVYATFCDRRYHYTYFCLTERPELYTADAAPVSALPSPAA